MDTVNSKQKKQKGTKTCTKTTNKKPKPSRSSWSELQYIDEEFEGEDTGRAGLLTTLVTGKKRPPAQRDEMPYDDSRDHLKPEAVCLFPSNSQIADIQKCATVIEDLVEADREPVNVENISQLPAKNDDDEDVELQAMFYLPKWDAVPLPCFDKRLPGRAESLKVILANVDELLSRSPPSLIDDLEAPPSLPPQHPPQPFLVSFSLDVDEDDDDEVIMKVAEKPPDDPPKGKEGSKISPDWPDHKMQPVRVAANSPTWDEVFGEEVNDIYDIGDDDKETDDEKCNGFKEDEVHIETDGASEEKQSWNDVRDEKMPHLTDGDLKDDKASEHSSEMDESIDLFGDDEAFLQMTIPDIPTPEDGVTPTTSSTEKKTETVHTHAPINQSSTMLPADGTHRLKTVQSNGMSFREDLTFASNAKKKIQETNAHNTTETKCNMHTPVQAKTVAENSVICNAVTPHFKSSESFDSSHDLFSVNFDLGYSLEESEDEDELEAISTPCMLASSPPKKQPDSTTLLPAVSHFSTPCNSFATERTPALCNESKLPTPQMLSQCTTSKSGALPSSVASQGARRTLMPDLPSGLKRRRAQGCTTVAERGSNEENCSCQVSDTLPHPVEGSSDSEDEVVLHKRRHPNKVNPLSSPKVNSDVDSPVIVKRKHAAALNSSSEMGNESVSEDDFQNDSIFMRRATVQGAETNQAKAKRTKCRKGRQFLDEEAQLSEVEEGVEVSSDEEDGEEQNRSLDGFVVDNTHISQGLNDSEMHGIYLKSVRSPAVQGKFKMSHRSYHNMDIFSQVPEMDETYEEDSFVVGSDVEEVGTSEEDVELLPEASFVDGRRQYATRRRVHLHKARARGTTKTRVQSPPEQRAEKKIKRTRVIQMNDSSEEETDEVSKDRSPKAGSGVVPLPPKMVQPEPCRLQQQQQQQQKAVSSASATLSSKVSLLNKAQRRSVSEEQQNERCRQRIENQHLLSDELDFVESELHVSSKKLSQVLPATSLAPHTSKAQDLIVSETPAASGSVCILVDSRCISSGVELLTSLRQRHTATVQVCSLDSSYFIVSNRMAVERHSQSDLAAAQNRKRLAERMNSLQGLFERVCMIVEKDRTKTGEASRPFQRTRYYDTTLAALVRAGVRLLWSDGAEESAGLLADMARLEHRKGHAIAVPLEVKGQQRQQALQLYLSLPSVNYVQALNMSHNFTSIAQLINSPIEAIQKGGCMSRPKAEEIYRFLRYSCDSFLINTSKSGINS